MNIRLFCFLIAAVLVSSCSNNDPQTRIEDAVQAHVDAKKEAALRNAGRFGMLKQASWLLGSWKGVIGKGVSVERWYKQDDSTYSGAGLFIKGKVTLSQEVIQLVQKGDDLYYIPTLVKDQDGRKPVSFKLTKMTDKEMVFEEPAHDFPQVIKYTRYGADSLVAEISGKVKGEIRSEQFPMKRSE